MIDHAGEHLGGFKVPKDLHLMSELPTNPTGKILQRDLREQIPPLAAAWYSR